MLVAWNNLKPVICSTLVACREDYIIELLNDAILKNHIIAINPHYSGKNLQKGQNDQSHRDYKCRNSEHLSFAWLTEINMDKLSTVYAAFTLISPDWIFLIVPTSITGVFPVATFRWNGPLAGRRIPYLVKSPYQSFPRNVTTASAIVIGTYLDSNIPM